jgi:hypothetical protein
MKAHGPFEPCADQFDFLLRRGDAALRFLLERVQYINLGSKPNGVDRAVGVAPMVFDQFKNPCPAESLSRRCTRDERFGPDRVSGPLPWPKLEWIRRDSPTLSGGTWLSAFA